MREESTVRLTNCVLIDAQGGEHHVELLEIKFEQEQEDIDFGYRIYSIAGIPTYTFTYVENGSRVEHRSHSVRIYETDPIRIEILGREEIRGLALTTRNGTIQHHFGSYSYPLDYDESPDEATGMGLKELGLGELLAQIDAELEEYDNMSDSNE